MQLASKNYIAILHLSKWMVQSGEQAAGFQKLKTLLELSQIKKVGVTLLGKPDVPVHITNRSVAPFR